MVEKVFSRFARALAAGAFCALFLSCVDEGPRSPGPRFDALENCGGEASAGAAMDASAGGLDASAADLAPVEPRPAEPAPAASLPPKVLLISVDGLRPDAIVQAPAPNLLGLACRGAYSWRAQTVYPSVTLPSHASMVSGFPPEVHGLLWNDWRPVFIQVPTVFSAASRAGLRTVMVVGKEKLQQLAIPGTVDTYVFAAGGEEDVAVNALAEIRRGFDLLFVHFPMVDITGHGTSWMSDPYLRQVARTDALIGRLLAAVPEHTTVIVSADHGGKGFGHFSTHPEDFTIPWIIAGPNVRKGHLIAAPIATTDTAATVAHLFGLALPAEALGRYVQEAFAR